jgi:hypothetical protein
MRASKRILHGHAAKRMPLAGTLPLWAEQDCRVAAALLSAGPMRAPACDLRSEITLSFKSVILWRARFLEKVSKAKHE